MNQSIISMREIQRNYKRILQKAREQKSPVFLGAYGKPQAVLLDIDQFQKLQEKTEKKQRKVRWAEMKKILDHLAAKGRQDVSLSEFVIRDRHAH